MSLSQSFLRRFSNVSTSQGDLGLDKNSYPHLRVRRAKLFMTVQDLDKQYSIQRRDPANQMHYIRYKGKVGVLFKIGVFQRWIATTHR